MMNKHVIGPWKVRNRLDIFNTRGTFIATAFTHDERLVGPQRQPKASYLGAAEANARLIAAAPELLAACEALYIYIKAYMAGGWADCPLCNLLDHDEDCPVEMAKQALALARAEASGSGGRTEA